MEPSSTFYDLINHSAFIRLLAVLVCFSIFLIASRFIRKMIRTLGHKQALGELLILYILRLTNIGLIFLCVSVVSLLLCLGYGDISLFLSSIFAVVGIALFAQWSILSNVTASMIIFFGFPYRVGDRIKILDKDDDMSGIIEEISLFHVILRRDEGNMITYPNTLILQKAVLKMEFPLPPPIVAEPAPVEEKTEKATSH